MKTFFERTKRLFFFILALAIGLFITYGISKISDRSKGPLTTILDKAEDIVFKAEQKLTIERRRGQRINKLNWFQKFKNDKEKLIHPDFLLLGASDESKQDSYEAVINLEDSLNTTFPLIHIFTAWGSKPEHQFPEEKLKTIYALGSVPIVTWEPWVSDFDEKEYKVPSLDDRMIKSMESIAKGTYDRYIKDWAEKAKEYKHPIYIRLGHEMNDPYRYPWGPKYNKPEYYVKAWQHIHTIFSDLKVDNIIWVWSPHLSYNRIEEYYPGDQYVDVVATGVLNYADIAPWSEWYTFEQIFGLHYDQLTQFKKPIMIAEFGSLGTGEKRAEWFSEAFNKLPEKYPDIMAVVFFHYPRDYSVSKRVANWYIKDEKVTTDALKKEFKDILKYKRLPKE